MSKTYSINRSISKKGKFFGDKVPKQQVERGVDEKGNPFIRLVDHVKFVNGRVLRYNVTKGWRLVQEHAPHFLLNNLLVKNGFGNLYK